MKTYNVEKCFFNGSDFEDITVQVNIPSPKEMAANSECRNGSIVVVNNWSHNGNESFTVSLWLKGRTNPHDWHKMSGMGRKDAIMQAATWLKENWEV